jgi:hypothetical protein
MNDLKVEDLAKVPQDPAEECSLSPFAEKEYISVDRTAKILGVRYGTVFDMYRAGLIEMVDYRKGARKRVKYSSIVAHCDLLRRRYQIADRRPPLSNPMLRHRDDDLLPFPMSDTIHMKEVMAILGYESHEPVRGMIHEGLFEGYQICEGGLWRISRRSLRAFIDRARLAPASPRPKSAAERRAPCL